MIPLRAIALLVPMTMAPDALPFAVSDVRPPAPGVVAGPPWISIEHPVNPYDATTRDAFLVVHAYHHGTPTGFPVSGTAEGIVNGERKSLRLSFSATSRAGVFALRKQWPDDGTWTLLVSVTQGPRDSVTAVVELGGKGEVASVRVPTGRRDRWTVPAAVAMADIDASLRARASRQAAGR